MGQTRITPRHGAMLCQPGTACHGCEIERFRGWWEEGKTPGFVPMSTVRSLLHGVQAALSCDPFPLNSPGARKMRVEQGRSAHGAFPALCQVFSSSLVVPDLPAYCTLPQQGEKSRAHASATASLPPQPTPSAHSSSKPSLCDLR